MSGNYAVPTLAGLVKTIRSLPVVDNHAHNIYRAEGLRKDGELIGITSEASGVALNDVRTSLAHIRAAKMLKELLELPDQATWADILERRAELLDLNADRYVQQCLQDSHIILLDDKYDDDEATEHYTSHDKFTHSPCKRIERIEAVASDILTKMHEKQKLPMDGEHSNSQKARLAWEDFLSTFDSAINDSISDSEVVGFKSVICYYTGLDIDISTSEHDAFYTFQNTFLPNAIVDEFEISGKPLNDFLVLHVCKLLATRVSRKPFQFHTGLGSNNESILLANPAYMQPLIARFESVVFVLLHSAYPYTRQAGYLATVYANCYLDIGLVWPELSRDGQACVLREALEQTPWAKLMWSTDGHYFPETYYLANRQGRKAMEKVVSTFVDEGDLTITQAMHLVKDVYFENANRVYGLGLVCPEISGTDECD